MVFRFLMLSDEVDDFRREIQIDADATFYDLHKAIISSVNFEDGEMASFFICSDNWEKEREITLAEMDTSSDEDSYIMSDCVLNDFLEDEKQKMMYVFEYLTDRAFFIELREIITGKNLDTAVCTKSQGESPVQFAKFDEFDISSAQSVDVDSSFYGDESYDINELDAEGFDGLSDDIESLSDDERF